MKYKAIGASEEIRTAHNSFARRDTFLSENKERIATDDDDVFHFIAYVPHSTDQCVYELDGLKKGPIRIASYADKIGVGADNSVGAATAWLQVAREAIQNRIERYAATEIKFNLMAIVKDNRCDLRRKLHALQEAGLSEADSDELTQIQLRLTHEEQKRHQWKIENDRRRHNYLPFCVELLKALAASGKLPELTNRANERRMVKRRKKKTKERRNRCYQ